MAADLGFFSCFGMIYDGSGALGFGLLVLRGLICDDFVWFELMVKCGYGNLQFCCDKVVCLWWFLVLGFLWQVKVWCFLKVFGHEMHRFQLVSGFCCGCNGW